MGCRVAAAEVVHLRQKMEDLREILRYSNSHKQIAETELHQVKQRVVHLEEQLSATRRSLDEARAVARTEAESVRGWMSDVNTTSSKLHFCPAICRACPHVVAVHKRLPLRV